MRDVCFVSNVCLQLDVPRKRGKYWEGISASDRISLEEEKEETRVEFSDAPGVSFPVAILSRTWYALRLFASIVPRLAEKIASLIYRSWHCQVWTAGMFAAKRKGSRYNKHLFFSFRVFFRFPSLSPSLSFCYASYLARVKRDKINGIKGSEKAFYFPPFRLYRE